MGGFDSHVLPPIFLSSDFVARFFSLKMQLHRKTKEPYVDMYPLYWTPSKEGVFMRYNYEFKRNVKLR